MLTMQDKVRGMFIGVGVGDALGMPFESQSYEMVQENFPKVKGYLKGRHPCGTYTDDTQLTIAVANAIVETGKLDMDAIAGEHILAYDDTVSGWGSTTREAVKKIKDGEHWSTAGDFNGQENRGFGNGVPMKIAPVAAYYALTNNFKGYAEFIHDFTAMTHQTSVAVSSAFAHTTALLECLMNDRKSFNAKTLIKKIARSSEIGRAYYPHTLKDDMTDRLKGLLQLYDIPDLLFSDEFLVESYGGGSCYVYNSLPFSYAFFLRGPYTLETLFDVAYAGGDSDTNASFVGGMMGALLGPEIFSDKLISDLQDVELLVHLADDLCAKLSLHS